MKMLHEIWWTMGIIVIPLAWWCLYWSDGDYVKLCLCVFFLNLYCELQSTCLNWKDSIHSKAKQQRTVNSLYRICKKQPFQILNEVVESSRNRLNFTLFHFTIFIEAIEIFLFSNYDFGVCTSWIEVLRFKLSFKHRNSMWKLSVIGIDGIIIKNDFDIPKKRTQNKVFDACVTSSICHSLWYFTRQFMLYLYR